MGELDFRETFKPLRESICDFTYFCGLIHKDLTDWNNIVGINARPNIFIKKKIIIKRVQENIDKISAPFFINDVSASSHYFQILLKNQLNIK